jgi:UDP-2-acetamido-3-amino-2,3-dideoxy-glucuronate N-acetyltransferase
MNYFVHPQAICESVNIGEKTRIWAFAHILPGAQIGQDCNICDHVFVENNVVIGHGVTIKCGVQLWDGVTVEDNVFIGPNVTLTNDRFPRSKIHPAHYLTTIIKKNASIGANATILPGIIIGENAMIGAGSVVTKSVPVNAIVIGNPAKIVGYVNTDKNETVFQNNATNKFNYEITRVKGVQLYNFPIFEDMRGSLSVGEFEQQIPFIPKRYFVVFDVGSSEIRGEHAHKTCQQFLICMRGACSIGVDDGSQREEIRLESPNHGLYLPPMVWGIQYNYTADALLLVFASQLYDSDDYIRDYQEFQRLINKHEMNVIPA